MKIIRRRIVVTGKVREVGFRYHVWQLATAMGVYGYVRNTPEGVTIEAEGDISTLESFLTALQARPPRYASIQSLVATSIPLKGEKGFCIITDES